MGPTWAKEARAWFVIDPRGHFEKNTALALQRTE